tara:strand:+ start:88 stop:534 length:447 start_codon:yes stop_codon:yes gene_type:complete
MIGQISIKTKFGWINATEEKGRIIGIKFGKRKKNTISKNLKKFRSSLNNYLSKKNKSINCKILLKGNSIQKKIWKELKKIRFGKTKTYGEIAKKYKLSPRYIGKICGQNKIVLVIPCHRVIRSDSTLGGFSSPGGIKLKKKLLDFEKN